MFAQPRTSRGSSPQMRGARAEVQICYEPRGIIPADAGSTRQSEFVEGTAWDHPRRCGEHIIWFRRTERQKGSSPQMRGALYFLFIALYLLRIIPADAGSTGIIHDSRHTRRDHPRRCGEHTSANEFENRACGSSPQMRGAPWATGVAMPITGIIPADAGSTGLLCGVFICHGDHPRRCGEHYADGVSPHG